MHAQVLASIAGNECAMPTPPFPGQRHSSADDIDCLVGRTRCGGTVPLISPHNDIPLPALLKRFVLIYFPIVLIFSAAVAASIWRDGQRHLERATVREEARITIARDVITRDFAVVLSDLRLCAKLPSLKSFLDTGAPAWRDRLTQYFLALSNETGRYAHVRYIDNEGHEVIRTNYDGGRSVIVPHEQLQDKSGRPYVRETLQLAEGEIYVSPMDLIVENDQVETPHRPGIRFGTPAFDSGGHKKGMVLLNYAGEILQRRFRAALQGGDVHSAMLLKRDGYWLSSPTPEDEWGFVLGRHDRNFGGVFPEAWGAISTSEHGTVLTRDGLFVYTAVYPLTDPARAAATVDAAHTNLLAPPAGAAYYWKIVSFVPNAALSGNAFYNQTAGRALFGLAYLLFAAAARSVAVVTLSRWRTVVALREAVAEATRFAHAMDNAPAYIYIKNKEHRYVYGNRLVLKLFGCTAEELPGSGDERFFPPETVARLKEIDDRVLAPGTPNYRVYWEEKHPIYDDAGEVWGLSGISTDITERKRAEQALALHAELVQRLSEGVVLIRTHDGLIVFTNPAFDHMFGYGPGELTGKPVMLLIAPTDKTPAETAVTIIEAVRQMGTWAGEIENFRKDGTRFWCLSSVSAFVHPEYGEVWLAIHQDITERKRTEAALGKTYEEIEDLYERAPCGYLSFDGNGLFVRINQTELEWLGNRCEEVEGKIYMVALLQQQSQATFRESFPRFKECGAARNLLWYLFRMDVSLRSALVSATAVRDAYGRFVISRSSLFDLTERIRLEAELARQARGDVLTGLNYRRHFFELAERELARSKRHAQGFSILMLDVDHFKAVNDTYGHDAGDEVLRRLSEVCIETLREIDIVGRIGGEEFAVLLPETAGVRAVDAAERLRLAIAAAAVPARGESVHFTVSIGVTSFTPDDEQADTLLKRADAAMYRAKRAGRNRVCVDETSVCVG